jgi:hypothetical protein
MFWTFKLIFDVNVLAFFWLRDYFGYFKKNWVILSILLVTLLRQLLDGNVKPGKGVRTFCALAK